MSKFIPVYMYPDRMPVDISFVFRDEAPAGKHGFARAEGENIVFEDGRKDTAMFAEKLLEEFNYIATIMTRPSCS